MNNLIKCKISRKDLKILHKKLCVYENDIKHIKDIEYQQPHYCLHKSSFCDKCILRNIKWNNGTCERDLCFAIWHADILDEPKGKLTLPS